MKEVTYEEWIKNSTPREMWVWNDIKNKKVKRKVVCILSNSRNCFKVVTISPNNSSVDLAMHCAEIEESKTIRMSEKYNEIFRLKDMLEKAKIPFDFSELHGGYHIVYSADGDKRICSVIEHDSSYGRQKDLLEIQGLMTKEEQKETQDTVLGYLTAENVFQRIKNHWDKNR